MSEFQEKLQLLKDGINQVVDDNPALVSSHSSDIPSNSDENSFPFQEEQDQLQAAPTQYNEKGRRKRNSLREKLNSVLAENRAQAAQQQQLMSYIQDQEMRLAEAENKAQQNAHYSNVYYEKSLENEEQRVLTELELAKENGDIKQEIALQKELAKIAAQQETQLLSKTVLRQQPQLPQQPQPMNYPEPQFQQDGYQEPVNEYFEEWLEEHPWANPHSPEYDSNLSQEVNEIAIKLNKHLKFNGAGNMIGTPEYYNTLSTEMSNRYGLNTDTDNNNDYTDNRAYEVAPVTTRGSSMADRYIARNQNYNVNPNRPSMRVTKDDWDSAVHLAPVLEKVYGKPFTVEESLAEYYKQKQSPKLKEILREMNYRG